MAGAPRFKVYNASGEYVAATKFAEDAAALLAGCYGDGATIRDGHRKRDVVWAEGEESQPAGESYDYVAEVVYARIEARWNRVQGVA